MQNVLVASLLLSAATIQAAPASQFVGQWARVDAAHMTLDIAPNGGNYIIDYRATGSRPKKEKFVGTFRDGTLVVDRGPIRVVMDIDQKTGFLLYSNKEFRRITATDITKK